MKKIVTFNVAWQFYWHVRLMCKVLTESFVNFVVVSFFYDAELFSFNF